MLVVGMDAAVRQKAHQMQGSSIFLTVFNGAAQRLVLEKVTVRNRFGNAGQLLVHYPASADIGMPHL